MAEQDQGGGNAKGISGLMVFALAALLGFGAVYLMRGASDNASVPPGESAPKAEAEKPKTAAMAAFVKKKTPEALPEISFQDANGKTLTLADFKGKTVLLNLWATWCAPCREEMPSLDRLQQSLGSDKFEVVALSLDRKGAEASKKFLDETKSSNLKLYVDSSAKQGTVLAIPGLPATILIDKEGREIGRLVGPAEWDSEDAKKLIKGVME